MSDSRSGLNTPSVQAHSCIGKYLRLTESSISPPAYVPAIDTVRCPGLAHFESQDEYYSTIFHELARSTGHPDRLGRFELDQTKFQNKEVYSKEELVAEFASAMLCHRCGVDSQASIKNSTAYIQSWSKYLRDNEQVFVQAVNQAYKAFEYITRTEAIVMDAAAEAT